MIKCLHFFLFDPSYMLWQKSFKKFWSLFGQWGFNKKCFWDLLTFRKTSIKSMLKKLESRTFQINYLAQSWHQIKKALTEWKVQKLSRWNWKCSGYRFCLPENGPREQTVWIRVRWVMELETSGMKLAIFYHKTNILEGDFCILKTDKSMSIKNWTYL